MSTDFCVVLTTFDDDAVGTNIIDALLSERLAACVQVQTIQSYYHWKGKVNCDAEKLVLIKTKRSLFHHVPHRSGGLIQSRKASHLRTRTASFI